MVMKMFTKRQIKYINLSFKLSLEDKFDSLSQKYKEFLTKQCQKFVWNACLYEKDYVETYNLYIKNRNKNWATKTVVDGDNIITFRTYCKSCNELTVIKPSPINICNNCSIKITNPSQIECKEIKRERFM